MAVVPDAPLLRLTASMQRRLGVVKMQAQAYALVMWNESPTLYEIAKQACHQCGLPWTDPRTGRTYPPPAAIVTMTKDKPLFKRSGKISKEEREHLIKIGRTGGKSRSEAKLKATKQNLRKAMAKRFPKSPKWRLP